MTTAPYHRPRTLRDALRMLDDVPRSIVLAGATDIYPKRTSIEAWGDKWSPPVVDISAIPELRGIEDRGDHWWIGATTTWSAIAKADLPPLFDGLRAAAREIGGIQIQNRGTIGGNIVTASPAGDSIPCLMALDAEIEVAGGVAFRVPAAQFFTGYRQTALAEGEIVTGIRIPKQAGRGSFLKLGARRYLVISIAMVSAVIEADGDGIIRRAAISVGACSAIAQRLPELEAALTGERADPCLVRDDHLAHLSPIDDIRASADYRKAAALQLVRDAVAGFAVMEAA